MMVYDGEMIRRCMIPINESFQLCNQWCSEQHISHLTREVSIFPIVSFIMFLMIQYAIVRNRNSISSSLFSSLHWISIVGQITSLVFAVYLLYLI